MKHWKLSCVAAAFMFAFSAAKAQETVVVNNVLGPEGPLVVDGKLYYVAWTTNTLNRWDGEKSVVLNNEPKCGHNGLALTKQRTFLVMCSEDPGIILETDLNGKEIRRWDTDASGAKLVGGLNDVVVATNGAAYATIFGPYLEKPTSIAGKILYLPPGGNKWAVVADGLNFANGIAISSDQKTLYVNETVGNDMVKYTINSDGTLSNKTNFALLNLLTPDAVKSWWLGPDSMKVDREGNIYVAQWSGGKVLKISPEGKLLHEFDIKAGMGTTNVAFDADEKYIYVTVVKNPKDEKAAGKIVRIPKV
jgi:gluconolactonase